MTSLKPVQGANIFCGPAVISAITGITTDEAEKLIQDIRHSKVPVRGVYDSELIIAFNRLGYKAHPNPRLVKNDTLFNTLCNLTEGVWVIIVPGHYVCCEVDSERRRWFIDNHVKKPMNAAASVRGGQTVLWIRRIEKSVEVRETNG